MCSITFIIAARHKTRKQKQRGNEEIMSEHPRFDRKKGFVALPIEILEIEMSPGAFRLLVELCRMANLDGYCWPSLSQLSDRLGRSRAALSGYLKELRAENLITTEEQKTSNGYNYRLKYKVTFWQDWRAGLRFSAGQKTECRVQPVERLNKDKNQINKNQVNDANDIVKRKLVSDWAQCFKGAPYPLVMTPPDPTLVDRTRLTLATKAQKDIHISTDIAKVLSELWASMGVSIKGSELSLQVDHLSKRRLSVGEMRDVERHIKSNWPAHWKRCPKQNDFEKLVKNAGIQTDFEYRRVLSGYLKRWELARKHLRHDAQSDHVTCNEMVAA